MADISKIKATNGTTYNIKDASAMVWPYQRALISKTYTNVIATSNDQRGGGFFYMKVRANTWNSCWRIKVRVLATVPGQDLYRNDSIFEIWGFQNTYSAYSCNNHLLSTSYRPIYNHSHFRVSATGYNHNCGGWIGFNLYKATNNLDTSYKRTVVVDLLEYENCTVEMQDSLITPDNIPERAAHTDYYSSTNTSYDNFDAYSYGLKQSGDTDTNTTSISNLLHNNGNFIADSAVYRYQLLFHVDDNRLTPLNNNNNVTGTTKTMLVNRTFDPFKEIFYYTSTSTVAANASIGAGSCFFAYSGLDLRYTFNITTTALTAHKNVYLKVSPQSDGMVKLASANPLTQDLPTTNDGFWYIHLGRAYNGYSMALYHDHPVYMHDGTSVKQVLPPNNGGTITGITMNGVSKGTSGVVDLGTVLTAHQDVSGKVNGPASSGNGTVALFDGTTGKAIKDSGFTIGCSVPADAKFTDTTYSNASLGQGYGTCTTAAATAAKAVSLGSYTLTTGGIISVKFTYAVPASATLNVNSRGAKAIYYKGAAIKAGVIEAGDVATFIYSSQYHLIAIDKACQMASDANAGLVSTGAQTFAGDKTFTDDITADHISSVNMTATGVAAAGYTFKTENLTSDGSLSNIGWINIHAVNQPYAFIGVKSKSSSTGYASGGQERYKLPAVDNDLTDVVIYDILTTKTMTPITDTQIDALFPHPA